MTKERIGLIVVSIVLAVIGIGSYLAIDYLMTDKIVMVHDRDDKERILVCESNDFSCDLIKPLDELE